MKQHKLSLALSGVAFVALTGFIFSSPVGDAHSYVASVRDKLKSYNADLGPLPELPPYKPVQYTGGELDPFKMQAFVLNSDPINDDSVAGNKGKESKECTSDECSAEAPIAHIPYLLEDYELDTLNMVGTIKRANGTAVLIKTPDAGVQETRVGEFIGRNNGQVISIHPDYIVIREKYKVPRGWQDRMATLELFN